MIHNTDFLSTKTKLDRLETLLLVLLKCKNECANDQDEWNIYNRMTGMLYDMRIEEKRKQGFLAVYPIVNGSAREPLFEGTKEQCKIFTDLLLESQPDLKGNIIVLPL